MSDPRRPLPPPGKASAEQLRRYIDDDIYYGTRLRSMDARRWRRAELYDASIQWLQKAVAGYDEGGQASQWVEKYWDPTDPMRIPTPVFNEGFGARVNESARLARPNYRPTVNPRSETPDLQARQGAQKAQHLLRHRLREMGWHKSAPLAYYHQPLYGGFWIRSEWEQTWDKTSIEPVLTGMQCPNGKASPPTCGFTLATPKIDAARATSARTAWGNVVEQPADGRGPAEIKACPLCPDHPGLVPFKPSLEETRGKQDALGRPLGKKVPMGDWKLSIPSPYDVFPRNHGYDMRPGEIVSVVHVHVEHLDWVALRYPAKVADVVPENAASLAKWHPVAGAPDIMQGMVGTRSSFSESTRIKEKFEAPKMAPVLDENAEFVRDEEGAVVYDMDRGRATVMAGDTLLFDGPLLLDSLTKPGETIARAYFDYEPWEFRDGGRRLQGIGLWEQIFDGQDAANEIRSQRQAVRQRLAVPIYVALKEHNFEIQGMRAGIPGLFATINVVEEAPQVVPQLMNMTTIEAITKDELQDAIQYVGRVANYVEVEKGQVPTTVSAASAIQFLKAAAGEQREPRLARIKECFQRAWKHGAELMAGLYLEKREVKFEDEDGEERWTALDGLDMAGQTDVGVEGEPDYDSRAKQVETVLEMLNRRLLNPDTMSRATNREIGRLLDAPKAIFEDHDLQNAVAQREWIRFRTEGRPPVVDPDDDHGAHYDDHGKKAHSEFFRALEEACNWDSVLKILSVNWDMELMMVAQDQDPNQTLCLQDRILLFWQTKLETAQWQPPVDEATGQPQPAAAEALQKVMYWRAHTAAHRLEEQMKLMRATAAAELPAPGEEATPSGTKPTGGAPPAAAAA